MILLSELGLGLATGTRLRARLESAASTAVRTPVLAVIEYNYERDGEIIVPAGARAVGHIRNGDRSGYVDAQFDSLLMPDGAVVPSRPPPRVWTCGRSKEKLRVRTRERTSWSDRCQESAKLARCWWDKAV